MNYVVSLSVVLIPLATFIIPGIVCLSRDDRIGLFGQAARVVLWSIVWLALLSLVATAAGVPLSVAGLAAAGITMIVAWRRRAAFTMSFFISTLGLLTPLLLVWLLLAWPALVQLDGLPTGDSQKAMYWAEQIITTRQLPAYGEALALWNRDPVDFYTPALHSSLAFILSASSAPYVSMSLFAVGISVATALLAAALVRQLWEARGSLVAALVAALLVLTQFRFLRYIREPGYHFQNIVGEFLLFGCLLLLLSLARHWRWSDAVLLATTAGVLALTHQFSTFLGILILGPAILVWVSGRWLDLRQAVRSQPWLAGTCLLLLIGCISAGIMLGLHHKIPHLFTTQPHLLSLVPSLFDYPRLMGAVWFLGGLAGAIVLLTDTTSSNRTVRRMFGVTTAVLLLLSQGPRLGIDIPPVRALFYTVVPLSVTAAYFLVPMITRLWQHSVRGKLASCLLTVVFVTASWSSTALALPATTQIRTNSTLTAELVTLIDYLKTVPESGAVLVDDYNKRATSWLIMSHHPVYARLSADLERQMEESRQSQVRQELYLRQLDYEKIFMLASRPESLALLRKHNIDWITGINGSSNDGLAAHPHLQESRRADNVVLYRVQPAVTALETDLARWLTKTTTLVNDIGDREDTFAHLPVSVRSTRLSEPLSDGTATYRVTTAPLIPLYFNVGDYVDVLWDQEQTGQPDTAVELYIELHPTTMSLMIQAAGGKQWELHSGEPLHISPHDVAMTEDGFITLTVVNPAQEPIGFDLIALGLAHTP